MTDTPPYPHIVYVESATSEARLFVPATVEPPDPPDPPDTGFGDAHASLECDGMVFTFDPKDGEELDPYSDPQGDFTQRNIRCPDDELPDLVAWYRPDTDNAREEWVFELGGAFTTPQANFPAYTVVITCKNGDTVDLEAPSGHYWFSRWRWQSAPRPVRRDYATLAAQNLIPHLDTDGITTGPILSVSDFVPMSTCGMPPNQGATGGYPGLGILTGWIAQYLVRGAPETAWRQQAEAINSYPTIVRDPDVYTPMDIVDVWPTATMYSAKDGDPYIPKGPSPLRTDQGHLPSTLYVPWLLTGDPYYLESMQFVCNYQQLSLPAHSRFMCNQRYWAWPTRAIGELVASCPDVVPSWLLPRSYWQHWLDICRGHIEDRAANQSDPYYYVFHSMVDNGQNTDLDPAKSGDHVWQGNFVCLVTAWLASWNDDWVEPAEWSIHSAIDRASATSGWVRSHCSPYHMRLSHTSVLNVAMTKADTQLTLQYSQIGFHSGLQVKIDNEVMTLGEQCDDGALVWAVTRARNGTAAADHAIKRPVYGGKYLSWSEASTGNIDTYDWTDTANNAELSPETTDLTYPSYQRAALAQALNSGLDVPGLKDAFDWLDAEVRRWVSEESLPVGDNWCVQPVETTRRRRRHRRSERTDPQWHPRLQALLDDLRGED